MEIVAKKWSQHSSSDDRETREQENERNIYDRDSEYGAGMISYTEYIKMKTYLFYFVHHTKYTQCKI